MAADFRQRVGHVSWILFLIATQVNSVGRKLGMTVLHELLAFALAISGVIVAVVVLFVLKNGRRLVWPAVIGLLLNGALLLIGFLNIISAYSKMASGR
jgi:FtsH-binding integral membrane protein